MTATAYASTVTRPGWGGANSDQDIHIEAYEGLIDGSFKVESMFRSSGLTNFRSVENQSNSYRGDRIGGVTVKARGVGERLDTSRVVTDKFVITVDKTSYASTGVDYQDDWTAPSKQAEISAEHGTAHAKFFDQAHMIMLIKAASWTAPAHLAATGSFYDGIEATLTGFTAATDLSVKADMIVQAHKAAIAEFIKRDLGGSLNEFVTLITPDWFNILLEHDKLMNVEFNGGSGGDGSGNSFAQRRVAWLNGQRVTETPRFPSTAIASHQLGPQFNVSATEAKCGLIFFHPKKTLLTVEACPMTVRYWDDKPEFTNVLDSYTMFNIGVRRGDAVAALFAD